MNTPVQLRLAVAAIAWACAGCAARGAAPAAPSSTTASPSAASSLAAEEGLRRAIERARTDSAHLPYTAADIHFMAGMIGHHAQAVVMSKMAETHGANPEVRRLAARILNAQEDEIQLMQEWLRVRNQQVPEAVPAPMKMTVNGHTHEMMMPGMLSDEQMAKLDAARGAEFDELFLDYMIQHHRGAVDMVRELLEEGNSAQDRTVFRLASDINVDQKTEISRMQKMLLLLRINK